MTVEGYMQKDERVQDVMVKPLKEERCLVIIKNCNQVLQQVSGPRPEAL